MQATLFLPHFVFNIIEGSTKALKNTETSFTSFIWRNKYTPNVYCQNSGKNFSFQYFKNWYLKNFSLNYVSNLSLLHWASKIEKISSSKYNKDLHTHSNWKWGFIFYYTFLAKEMNIFFLLITNVRCFFFKAKYSRSAVEKTNSIWMVITTIQLK